MTMAPIIMPAPMPPVCAYGRASDGTDGCTATAAYGASDDCTAHGALRECIRQWYRHCQSQ